MRFAPPGDRWIWDDGGDSKGTSLHRKSQSHSDFLITETDVHDYWNFEEQRNCPQPVEPEFLDRRFGGGHHFHYQVEHGDETTSPRPTPMDKPIIFPGDLRFLRQGEEDVSSNIEDGPPLAPFTTTPAPPIARNPVPLSTPTTTSVPPLVQRRPQSCGISLLYFQFGRRHFLVVINDFPKLIYLLPRGGETSMPTSTFLEENIDCRKYRLFSTSTIYFIYDISVYPGGNLRPNNIVNRSFFVKIIPLRKSLNSAYPAGGTNR